MKRKPDYRFRLYVARGTSNSVQALANLNALCQEHLAGRHKIEVIDVFTQQNRALEGEIRMTPTLIKLAPSPVKRMIGTLTQTPRVLQELDLDPSAT